MTSMVGELTERLAEAKKIADAPAAFKICEVCESIVASKNVICPGCHSYRFDGKAAHVIAHAHELAQRPRQTIAPEDYQ